MEFPASTVAALTASEIEKPTSEPVFFNSDVVTLSSRSPLSSSVYLFGRHKRFLFYVKLLFPETQTKTGGQCRLSSPFFRKHAVVVLHFNNAHRVYRNQNSKQSPGGLRSGENDMGISTSRQHRVDTASARRKRETAGGDSTPLSRQRLSQKTSKKAVGGTCSLKFHETKKFIACDIKRKFYLCTTDSRRPSFRT